MLGASELIAKGTEKIRNAVFLSAPAVWLEQKLIKADNTAKVAVENTGEAMKTLAFAGTSGLKWGLALGGIILALFFVAQFKSVTAAFKE